MADQAAETQLEPEADGAETTQDADHSIAQASSESAEPPKTEAQAVESVTTGTSNVAESAESAAKSASHVVSNAASSVAETAAAAGRSLGQAAGFSKERTEGEPSRTIYVGNLFFDVKGPDLKKEFERAGAVLDAKIITDQRGLSKGSVLFS